MVLELHVWGPAFSLPSIDAQCLATIAYFSLAVPKDQWVLIASSDPSVSPSSEFYFSHIYMSSSTNLSVVIFKMNYPH